MKVARIAVLCLALVAAIAAAWIAKGMLGSNKPVARAKPAVETVKVLTASSDLSLGKIIKSGTMRWREWPVSAVTPSLVTNRNFPDAMTRFSGARVRAPFVAGEPILRRKLVLNGKGGVMSAILPKGMRAISTRISPETGAGGFILPNDRVDVILTQKDNRGGKNNTFSRTILSNVRVLAIDQTIEEKKDKNSKVVVGKTATLELTPAQAEILAMSEKMGSLSLALRSLADAAGKEQNGPQLVGGNGRRGSVTVLRYGASSMERPRY